MAELDQHGMVLAAVDAWRRGQRPLAPVTTLLGVVPVDVAQGRAAVAMEVSREHHNPYGSVHGGLLCALADVAMGLAVATTLDGEGFTTLEQHIDHLRSVEHGRVVASATVTRRGRRAAHVACEITDEDAGRVLAHATCVCLVFALEAPPDA